MLNENNHSGLDIPTIKEEIEIVAEKYLKNCITIRTLWLTPCPVQQVKPLVSQQDNYTNGLSVLV